MEIVDTGWGPRDWWRWVCNEGFAWWVADHLPRRIALFTFVRVSASCGLSPDQCDYRTCYLAWERCRREDKHDGPCNGTPCRCTKQTYFCTRCILNRGHEGICI